MIITTKSLFAGGSEVIVLCVEQMRSRDLTARQKLNRGRRTHSRTRTKPRTRRSLDESYRQDENRILGLLLVVNSDQMQMQSSPKIHSPGQSAFIKEFLPVSISFLEKQHRETTNTFKPSNVRVSQNNLAYSILLSS